MKFIFSDSIRLFHVLFLPLAVCLLYFNTFHFPFVLNNSQIFENNTRPISEHSLESLQKNISESINKNRVFPNLSFALNFVINGVDVTGYRWDEYCYS